MKDEIAWESPTEGAVAYWARYGPEVGETFGRFACGKCPVPGSGRWRRRCCCEFRTLRDRIRAWSDRNGGRSRSAFASSKSESSSPGGKAAAPTSPSPLSGCKLSYIPDAGGERPLAKAHGSNQNRLKKSI